MFISQRLLRSFTREPDTQSGKELHVIPLSESPFVAHPNLGISEDDVERLEQVDQEDGSTTRNPLISSEYATTPEEIVGTAGHGAMNSEAAQVHNDRHAEEDESGPPSWLGIFFDLAWTTTFSNLTSNTQLTTFHTLLSYTIFFLLAWWLWAAQVTYDAKYFRNDWFHRIMLLIQLAIFGSLAAFTKDFDPFSTRVNPKESPLEDYIKDQYARKSMLGISALFGCTRLVLIVSYARVVYYLPMKNPASREQRKRLLLQVATYATSAILFVSAYVVVKVDLKQSAIWARVFLWLTGIGTEIVSYLTVPHVDSRFLANMDTMGERLSSLTSIILGEGLNGLAGTLVLSAGAIGFDAKTGGVSASATVVITFAFLLYFDGFKRRTPSTRHLSKWNVALHFPLHLSIIVLLESMKNSLIYSSIFGEIDAFNDRASHPKPGETLVNATIAAFRNIGIDLEKTLAGRLDAVFGINTTSHDQDVEVNEIVNQAYAQVYLNIFERFDIASDQKSNFTDYISTVGGDARHDNYTADNTNFTLYPILVDGIGDVQASATWILLSAAVFLACLGCMTLLSSWVPKHRYIWGSVLSRWIMALIVGLLALLGTDDYKWRAMQDKALIGAIVAIAFVVQFGIDHLVIGIAVRRKRFWRAVGSQSSIH